MSPNGSDVDTRFQLILLDCHGREPGSAAFGFYAGAIITVLGTVILVGPSVAGRLGKLKGTGPDSEQ